MITLFTAAKPFIGSARIAQINALRSWKCLHPEVEVILFGRTEGVEEVADMLQLVYIPDVETNEFGTPLIRSMFSTAQKRGRFDLQAYVNCDIILLGDFVPAVKRVTMLRHFLMVGQRWDIDLDREVIFDSGGGEEIRRLICERGVQHDAGGSDYFIYPRRLWRDMPPFAVGRPGWDNWMMYFCLAGRIPVIDASYTITAVHQNHDPNYDFQENAASIKKLEVYQNVAIAGVSRRITLKHANWVLSSKGLRQKRSLRYSLELFVVLPLLNPRYAWLGPAAEQVRTGLKIVDKRLRWFKWISQDRARDG